MRQVKRIAVMAALAGGILLAQTAPTTPAEPGRQGARAGMRQARGNRLARMAAYLNLTDAQKEQAKAIFQSARESAQPIAQQLRQGRQAVADAVKAGKSEAEIDQLANSQGVLMGQLMAIRAKALGKFHALLTPEQRQKADELRGLFHGGRGQGMPGHGFGPRG